MALGMGSMFASREIIKRLEASWSSVFTSSVLIGSKGWPLCGSVGIGAVRCAGRGDLSGAKEREEFIPCFPAFVKDPLHFCEDPSSLRCTGCGRKKEFGWIRWLVCVDPGHGPRQLNRS